MSSSGIGLLPPSAIALAAAAGSLSPEAEKNLVHLDTLKPYDKNVDCKFIILSQGNVAR